jgi:GNAT superfamily N-acetyltransferase
VDDHRSGPGVIVAPVPDQIVSEPSGAQSIEVVAEPDLADLLPLVRGYCDFYGVAPSDEALLELSRTLLADPRDQGVQLIARDVQARAIGFATVLWSWSTLSASRTGIMYDLYVRPDARGLGVADRLIEACIDRCAQRGVSRLEWQTAPDNRRSQAVYDRVGARREGWLNYAMDVGELARGGPMGRVQEPEDDR